MNGGEKEVAKEKVIALYGAGWLAQQISKNLQGVTVFIEDNCPKGKMSNQRHVYSPEEFKQRYVNHSGIFICVFASLRFVPISWFKKHEVYSGGSFLLVVLQN